MALGGTTYRDLWGDDWRAQLGLPVVQSEAIPEDTVAAVSFDPETGEVIDAAVIENVGTKKLTEEAFLTAVEGVAKQKPDPGLKPPYKKPRGNSTVALCCYCGQRGVREDEVPARWKPDLTGRLWCIVCQKTPAFRAATRKRRKR